MRERTARPGASLATSLLVAALAACTTAQTAGNPSALTEEITRAVYSVDFDGVTAHMDGEAKAQVTRSSIGELSDRMHALGAYQSLTQTSADADRGVYEYDLRFASGHLTARLRLDPSGKVGAYRVVPGAPAAPATVPTQASAG